jgi:ATP-dependent Clp protease protease subunit
MLSENTGKPIKQVEKDVDRDYYMSATEAVEYGIVDKVITRQK